MTSRIPIVFLTVLFVLASCGEEKHQPALLDEMPAGYDVYVTCSPSEIGIETVLETVGGLAEESHRQPAAPVADVLGFDPFLWEGWVDALALDTAGEVGLVVGLDNDEPQLIALFIPSSDPDRIREFVETVMTQLPGDEVTPLVIESGSHVVLAMAGDQSPLDDFRELLETPLSSDQEFSELRVNSLARVPAGEMYVHGGFLSREGEIETLLVTCFREESSLGFQFLVRTMNVEAIESGSVIAGSPNGSSRNIPEDATAAVRVSMDIDAIKEMMEEYMPPDAQMGVAMLGLDSMDDLFDIFSGDAWMAIRTDGSSYAGVITYGLADTGAFSDLLQKMSGMMGMSGQGMSTFQFQGNTCYRIDADIVEGIRSIEIGIVDDAMVVAGGYTLEDVADGITFEDYIDRTDLDMSDEGGFAFAADLGEIASVYGLNSETGDMLDLENFGYLALTGSVDGSLFSLTGSVDFGSGNPFAVLADIFATAAMARMTGQMMYTVPDTSPTELIPEEPALYDSQPPTRVDTGEPPPVETDGGNGSDDVPQMDMKIKIIAPPER
jgi:hypothetical protein